jgi:hypothetical protein
MWVNDWSEVQVDNRARSWVREKNNQTTIWSYLQLTAFVQIIVWVFFPPYSNRRALVPRTRLIFFLLTHPPSHTRPRLDVLWLPRTRLHVFIHPPPRPDVCSGHVFILVLSRACTADCCAHLQLAFTIRTYSALVSQSTVLLTTLLWAVLQSL